jgi:hypothetical protein
MTWDLNILINAQVVQLHANHDYQDPPIKSESKWSPKKKPMLGKNHKRIHGAETIRMTQHVGKQNR